MSNNGHIFDIRVPVIQENEGYRYRTELLFSVLEACGFSVDQSHNLYHGLGSIETLSDILESNAIMGPRLAEEYSEQKAEGKSYEFPEEYKIEAGNPPDNGDLVGFANLEHASHVATAGEPLDSAFNEKEPIILGFRLKTHFPLVSINYIRLDDPETGLGVLVAPKRIGADIEAKIKECYKGPDFVRLYVSFAPRPE